MAESNKATQEARGTIEHPMSVEAALNFKKKLQEKYPGTQLGNRLFSEELGFKPSLVEQTEISQQKGLTLTVDSEQLEAFGLFFDTDYLMVTKGGPGNYRTLVQNTNGEQPQIIEANVVYGLRYPDNNPLIVSSDLAEELGITEGKGQIRVISVYPRDNSPWPKAYPNSKLLRDRKP